MRRIATLLLLSIFLSACDMEPAAPMQSSTPTITITPTETPTPTPTSIPTSTLEPWLQSPPLGVVSVEQDDEKVYGLNEEGVRVAEFDVGKGIWLEPLTVDNLMAGSWDGYSIVPHPDEDGSYKLVGVSNLKIWDNGTVELDRSGKMMTVAYQVVSVQDEVLRVGLWEYINGEWSDVITNAVPTTQKEIDQWVGSLEILGEPGSKEFNATLKTFFDARDEAAGEMDIPAEFIGLSANINFEEYTMDETLQIRPKKWELMDWQGGGLGGHFLLEPIPRNSAIGYGGQTKGGVLRPIQVVVNLENKGYFQFSWKGEEFIHVPVAVLNTDGTTSVYSTFSTPEKLIENIELFTRENRKLIKPSA